MRASPRRGIASIDSRFRDTGRYTTLAQLFTTSCWSISGVKVFGQQDPEDSSSSANRNTDAAFVCCRRIYVSQLAATGVIWLSIFYKFKTSNGHEVMSRLKTCSRGTSRGMGDSYKPPQEFRSKTSELQRAPARGQLVSVPLINQLDDLEVLVQVHKDERRDNLLNT